MDLRDCLDQCSLGLLRQIATTHQVPLPESPARAEVLRVLAERLLQPGYLAQRVANLAEVERAALALVVAEGGQVRSLALERELRHRQGSDLAAAELLAGLLQSGVLFRAFQATGADRGEVYVAPSELNQLVPPPPPSTRPTLPPVEPPAETRRCSPSFNLFAMASFVRTWRQTAAAGRPGAATGGQLDALSAETAELTVELPGRTPRERWTLLGHLGLRLGLFAREEGGLQPTERVPEWLGQGEAGERQLWLSYLNSEQWNDLERAGSGDARFVGRTADSGVSRAQFVELIRVLPVDQWVPASDVETLVRELAPDFLREGFEVSSSRLVDLESGDELVGTASWERVEGPLVKYLLGGPLFWLGVVEWGLANQGWDRLRVTSAGRAWLEGSDEALWPALDPIELTEERQIIAPERCDLALLWDLEPYLELQRRGPPSVYELKRASFARGLEAGGTLDELRKLLERAALGLLPPAFDQALDRWAGRAGRFRLRPIVVLTSEDEAEMTAFLEKLQDTGLVRERLGPKATSITPARAGDVADALGRQGQLPELDAALRLMAGRRAYPALVDQQTLEALLFCIRLVKAIKPALAAEIPHADRLTQRLEQALGPIVAPRLARRARALARQLRADLK
jgi:hypothetical protein